VNDNLSNSSHCKGSKSMGGKGNGGKGKGSLYKDSDDFPAPADTIRHALDATDVIKNALTSGSTYEPFWCYPGWAFSTFCLSLSCSSLKLLHRWIQSRGLIHVTDNDSVLWNHRAEDCS
jgi:hypothetical protein